MQEFGRFGGRNIAMEPRGIHNIGGERLHKVLIVVLDQLVQRVEKSVTALFLDLEACAGRCQAICTAEAAERPHEN